MGSIISPTVRTTQDLAGNHLTQVWATYEYTSAGILPTGETIDLSPYMRRVEMVQATPASGALVYTPMAHGTDFPGNAGSGRMVLTRPGLSGVGGILVASGVAVSGTRAYIHAFGY
jgi:hypothetical protein